MQASAVLDTSCYRAAMSSSGCPPDERLGNGKNNLTGTAVIMSTGDYNISVPDSIFGLAALTIRTGICLDE